jgi:periplasmic protein TonB
MDGQQGATVGFTLLGAFALGIFVVALMRRQYGLLAGVVVATGAHGLFLFGFGQGGGGSQGVVEQAPTIEIEMPEVATEDVDEEIIDSDSAEEVPLEFAPPMLADVPSTVANATFTQKLQPPPPPSTPVSRGELKIPVNRAPPASKLTNLIDIKDLDQRPQVLNSIDPQYPYDLKREGVTGSVTLEFIVDTNGKALDIWVVESTHPGFEQAAIQALAKWKFRPGKKSGKTVNTKRVRQLLKFSLNS